MSTVYAAFNTHQAVDGAVAQLLAYGFSRSSITFDADATFRDPPLSLKRESGILSAVENFFARRRESQLPFPTDLYEQTIRRGGVVVAVAADTAIEEQTARTLLRDAGSIDVAQHRASRGGDQALSAASGYSGRSDTSDIESTDRAVAVGGLPLHRCSAASTENTSGGPNAGAAAVESFAPIGPMASEADFQNFRHGSFEIREQVDVITLTKVTRVIEELSVNKSVAVYSETINDTVRGTALEVERIPASGHSVGTSGFPP